jgi:hypothetical protein
LALHSELSRAYSHLDELVFGDGTDEDDANDDDEEQPQPAAAGTSAKFQMLGGEPRELHRAVKALAIEW